MKKISQFFKKFIIVTLLGLTMTNTIIGVFLPPQNTIELCAEDNSTKAEDDDVEPLPAVLYTWANSSKFFM